MHCLQIPKLACSLFFAGLCFVGSACSKGELNFELLGIVGPFPTYVRILEGQKVLVRTLPADFLVSFGRVIDPESFDTSAIIQNGTATDVTWSILPFENNQSFILRATALGEAGTLRPSVQSGKVKSPSGYVNAASTEIPEIIFDNVAPAAPTELLLVTPGTSPGTHTTPTIQVNGVMSGDRISLHTDPYCTTTAKASSVASGTSIELSTSALVNGVYTFYARAADPVENSVCSTASVSYTVDSTPIDSGSSSSF